MRQVTIAPLPDPGEIQDYLSGAPSRASGSKPPLAALKPRSRTSHACDRCREMRAKCSGELRCSKCRNDGAVCRYSDRKRERNKLQLATSAQLNNQLLHDGGLMLEALMSLTDSPKFALENPDILALVDKMSESPFGTNPDETMENSGETHMRTRSTSGPIPTQNEQQDIRSKAEERGLDGVTHKDTSTDGEHLVGTDVGSPDLQRELHYTVDLGHGAGMSGYAGKMSSASWLRRVHEYLVATLPPTHPDLGTTRLSAHAMDAACLSYFMDDEHLLAVDEDEVDPVRLPRWADAVILIAAYFHSLHGAFHWVQCANLVDKLKAIYNIVASGNAISLAQRKHLALANMVWAVGAKWLQLTGLDQQPSSFFTPVLEDHLIYYARARALGLDHRMQLDHPTMELIQGMAVLAFYLMVNGSIQRAWMMVGQAIRHAIAMGLHLKVARITLSSVEARDRARLWYSLFRLEINLSELTGRPKCIGQSEVSVSVSTLLFEGGAEDGEEEATEALPLAGDSLVPELNATAILKMSLGLDENIAGSFSGGIIPWGIFALAAVDMMQTQRPAAIELSQISDKIGDLLYLSPTDETWGEIQSTVQGLEQELSQWQAALPPSVRLESIGKTGTDSRSNLELELYLCSIKMILYRPFLSEIVITGESSRSMQFNQTCARNCLHTAIQVTQVLPDSPIPTQVLQILPWWSLLHYVCQAGSILLLELCLDLQHMKKADNESVMAAMGKIMHYAWVLAPLSKSAYKAWSIMRVLLDKVVVRYPWSVLRLDLTLPAAEPRNWSPADQESLLQSVADIV